MLQMFWKKMKKNEKGFTLVELLVVVVILGILATLAVQTIGGKAEQAREAKAYADLRTIVSALELYKIETGDYPDGSSLSSLVDDYLKKIPNGLSYTYSHTDGSNTYTLQITTDGQTISTSNL